jgi:hypothetical protein
MGGKNGGLDCLFFIKSLTPEGVACVFITRAWRLDRGWESSKQFEQAPGWGLNLPSRRGL